MFMGAVLTVCAIAYLVVALLFAISFYDDYMPGWQCLGYGALWPAILILAGIISIWSK